MRRNGKHLQDQKARSARVSGLRSLLLATIASPPAVMIAVSLFGILFQAEFRVDRQQLASSEGILGPRAGRLIARSESPAQPAADTKASPNTSIEAVVASVAGVANLRRVPDRASYGRGRVCVIPEITGSCLAIDEAEIVAQSLAPLERAAEPAADTFAQFTEAPAGDWLSEVLAQAQVAPIAPTASPAPIVVAQAAAEPAPCDLFGPQLPRGIAVARGLVEFASPARHAPGTTTSVDLLAEAHGPDAPQPSAAYALYADSDEPGLTIEAMVASLPERRVQTAALTPPVRSLLGMGRAAGEDGAVASVSVPAEVDQTEGPEIDRAVLLARRAEAVLAAKAPVGPDIAEKLLEHRRAEREKMTPILAMAVGPEIDGAELERRALDRALEEVAFLGQPVGPQVDELVLAARWEQQAAIETLERDAHHQHEARMAVANLDWRDDADPAVGPPLPDFLAVCQARFEAPLTLFFDAAAGDVVGPQLASAAAPYAFDREPSLTASADGERMLPFDPLAAEPFDTRSIQSTRRAFEELLASDAELHTVRYVKDITHKLKHGETFSQVLAATGLGQVEVDRWVQATQRVYDSNRVYAGQDIRLTVELPDRELKALRLDIGGEKMVVVRQKGEKIAASVDAIPYERSLRVASTKIEKSLYVSAVEEGIPDRVVSEMAEILGWEINFGRDLQPGAGVRVIYEELTRVDTARARPGRVMAVEVSNRGDMYEAFYFENADTGEGSYYDRDGEALGRSFLRFPVSYSRISSPFSKARYHPVLKRHMPHYGVDFAAPTGTPVRAVANGKVLKAGWYGGNGRFIKVRHDPVYETGYAHLSRIASGVKSGAEVKKGQVIGYVGATGLATGPHLHFAMYRSGKYTDPMKVDLPRAEPLEGNALAAFKMKVAMMDRAYAEAGEDEERSTQVAAVEIEPSGDDN